jgi:beige protein homolog 1
MNIGIVKKWLDTLKGESFSTENFELFLGAFISILSTDLSTESLRTLALYITYAIYKPESKSLQMMRSARIMKQQAPGSSRKPTPLNTSGDVTRQPSSLHELSREQIALRILNLYSDLLCRANDTGNIKKFARTVTNKV